MVSEAHPIVAVPAEAERLRRRNDLLGLVVERNPFQRGRLGGRVPLRTVDDLADLPFTTKGDLVSDQTAHPPFGTNLTCPVERYTHLHQTSGTTGQTLRILDTPEDWAWWRRSLAIVFRSAGVGPEERGQLVPRRARRGGDRRDAAVPARPDGRARRPPRAAPDAGRLARPGPGRDARRRAPRARILVSGALDYGLGERAAVVTGAGTGIGEAVARTLAAAGASVLIADVHAPSARAVAEPIAAGLSSVFSCLRAEVRAMRAARTGGAIVNTASIFGMLAAGAGCRRRARRWGEAAYSSSHATFTYPDRNGLTSPDSGS